MGISICQNLRPLRLQRCLLATGPQSLNQPNTNIGIQPHQLTVRAHAGIPLLEVRQRNLILVCNRLAPIALDNLVERFTVCHHPRLRRRRRRYPVPFGSCRGHGFFRRCGRRGRPARGFHANIGIEPQAVTAGASGRVPGEKLRKGNAVLCAEARARVALDNEVELGAVWCGPFPDGRWGGDAVAL